MNESGRSHGETGPAVWGPRRSQGGRPAPRQAVAALTRKPRPSRFGSFEIFKPADESTGRAGPSVGRNDIRVQMLDYVVGTFYPEIQAAHAGDSVQRNAAFFREVRAPAGPPAEGATQPLRPVLRLSCPSPPGLHLQGMRRRPVHPMAGGGQVALPCGPPRVCQRSRKGALWVPKRVPKRPQLHKRHRVGGAGSWALAWAGGPFKPLPWQPGTAWTSAGLPVHEVP